MKRRVVLSKIVQGFTIAGAGFLAYPFIRSFVPSFKQDLDLDIDLKDLSQGESKVVHWLGRNITIGRRKPETIFALENNHGDLKDPSSAESEQPIFAANRTRSLKPEYFVAYNNCTHLGCEVENADGGFKCPCHQSDFDAAGRVIEGAAAPTNLEIPHYEFVSEQVIRLQRVEAT